MFVQDRIMESFVDNYELLIGENTGKTSFDVMREVVS